MNIQSAVAGNVFPQQDISQELTRVRTAEHKAAVMAKVEASLPGNRRGAPVESVMADLEKITLAFNKKLKFVVDHQSHEV
ncbi:MAG: hypothetical protein LBN92_01530, partial [Treponema sp.]|nr:hypothetical protein [Treponema sp.]